MKRLTDLDGFLLSDGWKVDWRFTLPLTYHFGALILGGSTGLSNLPMADWLDSCLANFLMAASLVALVLMTDLMRFSALMNFSIFHSL